MPAARKGAALRLPGRRDRLRSGPAQRHLFAHLTAHIFDSLLTYDYLARPFKLKPLAAEAMPEVSEDFRTFTFQHPPGHLLRRRSGVQGQAARARRRGLRLRVQAHLRPEAQEPGPAVARERGHRRPARARAEAAEERQPFDYDSEGRRPAGARPLHAASASCASRGRAISTAGPSRDILGAVAREVVEAYGDQIMDHPVGTGPFRLAEWRRSSRIVLATQPELPRACSTTPSRTPTTPRARRSLQRFKGRRLPMVDKVEIAIIEQSQPRWLSFLNGEQDFLERLPDRVRRPGDPRAASSRPTSPSAASSAYRVPRADVTLIVLQHGGPGGRRLHAGEGGAAPGDDPRHTTSTARSAPSARGQAIPAQTIVPPLTEGYDADLRTEMGALRPGPGARAARPVRLRRPRRRRLARAARRQPAGARVRHPVRPALAPARRAVEEEPRRARHPDRAAGRRSGRRTSRRCARASS